MSFEDEDLTTLMDRIRDEYDVATWNEQKIRSGGSFWTSPTPLVLMADAFQALSWLVPIVETRRAALGGRSLLVWIDSCDERGAHGEEVHFVHHESWPRGNDYNGPAIYVQPVAPGQTFAIAASLRERVDAIARTGKLAIVTLVDDAIDAVY